MGYTFLGDLIGSSSQNENFTAYRNKNPALKGAGFLFSCKVCNFSFESTLGYLLGFQKHFAFKGLSDIGFENGG